MEQDKKLKEILLKGAEVASADFTEAVMKRVNTVSTNKYYYQPLVSNKVQKAFVYIFIAIAISILLLCLIIASPNLPLVNLIRIPPISVYTINKILGFIFSFWTVVSDNFYEVQVTKIIITRFL